MLRATQPNFTFISFVVGGWVGVGNPWGYGSMVPQWGHFMTYRSLAAPRGQVRTPQSSWKSMHIDRQFMNRYAGAGRMGDGWWVVGGGEPPPPDLPFFSFGILGKNRTSIFIDTICGPQYLGSFANMPSI